MTFIEQIREAFVPVLLTYCYHLFYIKTNPTSAVLYACGT
jgi:hypothetical protein